MNGRHFGLAFIPMIAAAAIAPASTLELRTVPFPDLTDAPSRVAKVTALEIGGRGGRAELELAIPATRRIDLAPGTWRLSANASGYHHSEQLVTIAEDRKGVSIELWETAPLTGTLAQGRAEAMPDAVTIDFTPAPGPVRAASGRVTCPLLHGEWRCNVPVGLYDLRIGATRMIPHYRWGVRVARRKGLDVGAISFKPGSSASGLLRFADSSAAKLAADVKVQLAAVTAEASFHAEDRQRERVRQLTAIPDKRGFYQFQGLAPGDYELMATAKKLVSNRLRFSVRAGMESEILDPLILDTPRRLELLIDPAQPPGGGRWQVELARVDDGVGRRLHRIETSPASLGGEWTHANLQAGNYRALLRSQPDGTTWQSTVVEVEDAITRHTAQVPLTRVSGNVRLGKRPLAAALRFGGEYGVVNIAGKSDDDGKFEVVLPRNDRPWDVLVESDAPRVSQTVRKLRLHEKSDGGATAEIVLPDTVLSGRVIDTAGNGVARALVTISSPKTKEVLAQIPAERNGEFVWHGGSENAYLLQAAAGTDTSESRLLNLEPGDGLPNVQLVIRPSNELTGLVTSASGAVPGAYVAVIPTDVESLVNPAAVTDAGGGFKRLLPKGSSEVDVAVLAPGFPMRAAHIRRTGEPMTIPVGDQPGGTLVFRIAASALEDDRHAVFIHSGAVFPVRLLITRWRAQTAAEGDAIRVTAREMEPGQYTVCSALREEYALLRNGPPRSQCKQGTLAPGGVLSLE